MSAEALPAKWSIEFTIQGTPVTINEFLSKGWKARWQHSKKWQLLVDHAVILHGGYPDKPLKRARVHLARFSSGRRLDTDNLYASFKPVIDALKTQKARDGKFDRSGKWRPAKPYIPRMIDDDDEAHIELLVDQLSAPRGKRFITVKVEEI